MRSALVIIIAYLLGSIPSGYLIVRATQGGDIRATGSGGTGATNVSRSAGRSAGLITLLLDAAKGMAAVIIAEIILKLPVFESTSNYGSGSVNAYFAVAAAGIAVIVGHMFPAWLGFKGGKGVATALGVFLVSTPLTVALAAPIFFLVVWRTRYVSLGSIVAVSAAPLFVVIQNIVSPSRENFVPTLLAAIASAGLIIFAHRGNLGRLRAGIESKI